MRDSLRVTVTAVLVVAAATVPSPSLSQELCGRDSLEVEVQVRVSGFGTERQDLQEASYWRPVVTQLFDRCPRCRQRGDLELISGAIRSDSAIQDVFPAEARFEDKDTTRLQPLDAVVQLRVDDLSAMRREVDVIAVGIVWQWTRGPYARVAPTAIPVRRAELRDRARLIRRVLDDLRRRPDWRCLITRQQDPTRGFSVSGRLGLWTGEVLTEQDLGGRDDVRLEHVSIGVQAQHPLFRSLDLRGRAEAGAVLLYTTEWGGPLVAGGKLQPSPVPSLTFGGAVVWYPLTRTASTAPYISAGADVLYVLEGVSKLELEGWSPELAHAGVPTLGGTLGLGITMPIQLEVTARWSRPEVTFLGHSRQSTVLDVSTSFSIFRL